jgi:hypothetical protein
VSQEQPALPTLEKAIKGKLAIVVGAGPVDEKVEVSDKHIVIAVNGGIFSTVGPVDVWVVNSRTDPWASWGPDRVALAKLMLKQAKERQVRLAVFLAREDSAPAVTLQMLKKQGTQVLDYVALTQLERHDLEYRAGARDTTMGHNAVSAGCTAVCLAFVAGAAAVLMRGFSWEPGYANLESAANKKLHTRGHEGADKKGFAGLTARYGTRLENPLAIPPAYTRHTKERQMAKTAPRTSPAAPSAGAPVKVRAKKLGFYNLARRRPGDVFTLRDPKHFSERWMERVTRETPERLTHPAAAMRQQHQAIMSGKSPRLQPNAADLVEEPGQAQGSPLDE